MKKNETHMSTSHALFRVVSFGSKRKGSSEVQWSFRGEFNVGTFQWNFKGCDDMSLTDPGNPGNVVSKVHRFHN